MPQPKSKNAVGLGNTLMNDRFGKGKGADRRRAGGVTRINHATGEEYITSDKREAAWVKMRSVTEQGALDEFLETAQLADTDFTAEKMNNVKIIHVDQKNPYLLSAAEEKAVLGKQKENRGKLTVPRRPKWDSTTTPEELDRREREAFLNWRRGLAELQENQDLLMTPFERNLEVWRQLWRVIERSDVVVQIVDARNPLMFRSEDLEDYVKEVNPAKKNLLLINKADMMTYKQRRIWADYLKGANIAYRFFSASLAKEMIEAEEAEIESGGAKAQKSSEGSSGKQKAEEEEESSEEDDDSENEEDEEELADTRILTVDELEDILLQFMPEGVDRKLQVGLVGYPNVGKSSTINALIGAKKVSVSATPGKTKHFQTLHLSDKIILCDCPGLVFPNFASTKAELVCNGVLPIDQLREYTGPAQVVARRIPQHFLEAIYTIKIHTRPLEEGGTGKPTASELLSAYARHRGFMTQGMGQPDESRAARYILKDYVNGKLLWVSPPPMDDIDPEEFNAELYDVSHLPENRRAAMQAAMEAMALKEEASLAGEDDISIDGDMVPLPNQQGAKSKKLDKAFFRAGNMSGGVMKMPFNHKYSEQGMAAAAEAGKVLSKRKQRELIAIQTGVDPKDVVLSGSAGKRHFKGSKSKSRKTRFDNKGITDDL
ncbi:large subunit GTPase 1 [Naviculisporaceae sp. PSN 640]